MIRLSSRARRARRARRAIAQKLVFAATVILALVLVDLLSTLLLPLGVLGHAGSTVVVGLNGLRLSSGRAWRRSSGPTAGRRDDHAAALDMPTR